MTVCSSCYGLPDLSECKFEEGPSIMSGCLVLMLASFRSLGYITILKLNWWSPGAVTLGNGQSKWELTAWDSALYGGIYLRSTLLKPCTQSKNGFWSLYPAQILQMSYWRSSMACRSRITPTPCLGFRACSLCEGVEFRAARQVLQVRTT